MNNIDFSNEPLFSSYVIMLILTGTGTFAFALTGLRNESVGKRVGAVALGLVMFGYGVYLAFIFEGGTYHVFWQVFLAPVVLISVVASSLSERKKAVVAARAQQAERARRAREILRAREVQRAEQQTPAVLQSEPPNC